MGSQGYRGARDLGISSPVGAARPADMGSQGYRGARDLGISSPVGATSIP